MLADDFLPVHDVSDSVATVVRADVKTTWNALLEVDLIEVGRQRGTVDRGKAAAPVSNGCVWRSFVLSPQAYGVPALQEPCWPGHCFTSPRVLERGSSREWRRSCCTQLRSCC